MFGQLTVGRLFFRQAVSSAQGNDLAFPDPSLSFKGLSADRRSIEKKPLPLLLEEMEFRLRFLQELINLEEGFLLGIAIALLQQPGQLIAAAIDTLKVIVVESFPPLH